MGKYSTNARRQTAPPRNQIPAGVRGIGCISFVLIPFLSYGVAEYWIQQRWPGTTLIPPNLMGQPNIPSFFFSSPALSPLASFLQSQTNLGANLLFALAFTMIISGFMAIIYGYIYSMFGPSKYGPTDVPPPRVKPKKYTR
jgi:ABC-type antimicrobial peptide transport system permease subunit